MDAQRSSTAGAVEVLFLVSSPRSGSTLVGNVLGEPSAAFHAGELDRLWVAGWSFDKRCGCGCPTGECRFWAEALGEVRTRYTLGRDLTPPLAFAALQRRAKAARARPSMAIDPAASEFAATVGAIYSRARELSGASLVIDSSKMLPYVRFAAGLSAVSGKFLHLVRDPRAVVFSRQAGAAFKGQSRSPARSCVSVLADATRWAVLNLRIQKAFGRSSYALMRYEELVVDPIGTLRRALESLHIDLDLSHVEGNRVVLSDNHVLWGNRSRREQGTVAIRQDTRWLREMPAAHRLLTTAVALPAMLRFGYPLRSAAQRRATGQLREELDR